MNISGLIDYKPTHTYYYKAGRGKLRQFTTDEVLFVGSNFILNMPPGMSLLLKVTAINEIDNKLCVDFVDIWHVTALETDEVVEIEEQDR